jgi:DNA-binding NarL/FixJ family response regulator
MSSVDVLVIDPDRLFRQGLEHILAQSAYRVVAQADDAESALAQIHRGIRPLLVIIDYRRPSGADTDAIRTLRGALPGVPIAHLTSEISPARLAALLEAGVDALLLKDINAAALEHYLGLVMVGEKVFPTRFTAEALDGRLHDEPADERGDGPGGLSRREAQIVHHLVDGHSNKAIANALGITEATVKRITQADIRGYYREHFRPNNATLIVVGDVRPDDIHRRVTALFGGWARRNLPSPVFTKAPVRDDALARRTTIYLIDKPGAPQSSVRVGAIGVARSTPDYFPLLVMNTVLGVPFTSRLNQNLRETHGYTYGAGSRFDMRREPGPFTARAEVVATKTDSSLIEFMKELRGIRDTVPQAELQKAKRYLQLQLPALFETTGDIAFQLTPLAVHGLPLDFYNNYVQQIERVSQADVQRVARKYINPERLSIVVVGDRKEIEPGLRKLGMGDVEIRDIYGKPITR